MRRIVMAAAAATSAVLLLGVVSGSAAVNDSDRATTFTVDRGLKITRYAG